MNILFVCNEYPPYPHGGIGVFVKNHAENLSKKGHQCVAVGIYASLKRSEENIINGVYVYRIALPKWAKFQFRLFRFNISIKGFASRRILSDKIDEIVRNQAIDLVESYDWSGPLFRKPRKKLAIRIHGSNLAHRKREKLAGGKITGYWERRNMKFADEFVSVSKHFGQISKEAFGIQKPIRVIPNYIDTSLFFPQDTQKDKTKLLFVGRLDERKGIMELIQAFSSEKGIHSKFQLVIIGKGSKQFSQSLKESVPAEVRSRVSWLGQVPREELPVHYSSSILTILPSRSESFGLVALESMACGTPILMSSEGPGTEIIENGVDGFLADIQTPERLKNVLLKILEDPEILQNSSKNAVDKICNEFSAEVILARNEEFYDILSKN